MIFPKGNSSHHLERMGEFLQSVVKTGKYSYKEAVIDELATASPSEYLTKISIQVF
jgi:RNA-binding protein YhbY